MGVPEGIGCSAVQILNQGTMPNARRVRRPIGEHKRRSAAARIAKRATCTRQSRLPEDLWNGWEFELLPSESNAWRSAPAEPRRATRISHARGLVFSVGRSRRPHGSGPAASALHAGARSPRSARLGNKSAFAALTRVRAANNTRPVETRRGHK